MLEITKTPLENTDSISKQCNHFYQKASHISSRWAEISMIYQYLSSPLIERATSSVCSLNDVFRPKDHSMVISMIENEDDSEGTNSDEFDDEFESDGESEQDEASSYEHADNDSDADTSQCATLDSGSHQEGFRQNITEIMRLIQEAHPKKQEIQCQNIDLNFSLFEKVLRLQSASLLSTKKKLRIKETTGRFFDQVQGPFFLYPADVHELLLKEEIVIIDLNNSNKLLEQPALCADEVLMNELEALILTQSLSLWNIIMSYSISIEEKGVVETEKARARQVKAQERNNSKGGIQSQPAISDIGNIEINSPIHKKQKFQHTYGDDLVFTDVRVTHAVTNVNNDCGVVKKVIVSPHKQQPSPLICGFGDFPLWRPVFSSLSAELRDNSASPPQSKSTANTVPNTQILDFLYSLSVPSADEENIRGKAAECVPKGMSSGSMKLEQKDSLSSLSYVPSSTLYFSRLCDSSISNTAKLLKPHLLKKIRYFLSTYMDSTTANSETEAAQARSCRAPGDYGNEVNTKPLNTDQLQYFLPLPLCFESSTKFEDFSSLSDLLLEDELLKILINASNILENEGDARFPRATPRPTLTTHLVSSFEVKLFNIITNSSMMGNYLLPSSADKLLFHYFVIFLIKILPYLRDSLIQTRTLHMKNNHASNTPSTSQWDLKLQQQHTVAALILPVILFLLQIRVVRWTCLTWSTSVPPTVESRISIPLRPKISSRQLDILRSKDSNISSLESSFQSRFRRVSSSFFDLSCATKALKAGNYYFSPMRVPKSDTGCSTRIPKLVQLKGIPMWWSQGYSFGCTLLAYPLPPFLSHGLFMLDVIESDEQKGYTGRELIAKIRISIRAKKQYALGYSISTKEKTRENGAPRQLPGASLVEKATDDINVSKNKSSVGDNYFLKTFTFIWEPELSSLI